MADNQKITNVFTVDDIRKMLSAIQYLIDASMHIYNDKYSCEPSINSMAIREWNSFPDQEVIKSVYSRGILSMESAADHLMCFADSVTEPANTIAPWTCIHGLLESCSIALWFLDPSIDAKERAGRCFAFRYKGFIEQIKFLQKANMPSDINKVEQRIKDVEQDALSLGFLPLRNNKGEITGIAKHMPTIVDLIETTLGCVADYRLLSAVAHGHHWAIQRIGFHVIDYKNPDGQVVKAFEKYLDPSFVLYIAQLAIMAFAKVLWYVWQIYGWDLKGIGYVLDQTFDQLQYKAELRFWHAG